jgi:hypothetical protein
MNEHKLDDASALACGGQLVDALDRIEARHGWSNGDTVAVAVVAMTEIIARRIGPTKTLELLRGHADELESEHKRRAVH